MPTHRPNENQSIPMDRRNFLRRAAAAGIALPSMAAILAACGKGAETGVNAPSTGASGSGNQYGTGGIGGAPYPLARQNAPVTWTVDPAKMTPSGQQPEQDATLQVLRWPYYLDQGVLDDFKAKYKVKDIVVSQGTDMQKILNKMAVPGQDYDIVFGVNVWALGRSIAAGQLRPYNLDYMTNFKKNVWDQFQSPFYDVGSHYSVPYSVWNTGIFWRNDHLNIDPASMSNPYDVFWNSPPVGKTHLLGNAQDVLSLALFHDGLTDVNVTDPATISKAKDEIAQIATAAGGIKYDHVEYDAGDILDGTVWLHQSWSGNASDTVVFLGKGQSSDVYSYYWPGSDGHPANVDNDLTVLGSNGKNPVLAHLLADWVFAAQNSLNNFTNTTGYQMPVKSMTRESMTSSGIVPTALETVIVTEDDFSKGSRELELAPDANDLWNQAFAELTSGV